ncbi:MAG: stage II sporulation protein R [Clostridia bacterium]|nr:stage II sporulation protein R [Oscillospiraceae bacterium]MBQ6703126.1 stage II sporulation protein R [Clostridia bacterium]
MKKRITFCVSVVLLMLIMPFLPVRGEGEVYEKTLRLHVLANSDSTEDQSLKLLVRDAVVEETCRILDGCTDKDAAERLLTDNLDTLKNTAVKTVEENGFDYDVTVSFTEEYYPEREYGEVRLPSGRYKSLRVNIGQSTGQNWWCVLFPPLCTKAAEADMEEALVETGFTPNQVKVLTDADKPKYVIRFRILEWFSDIAELFK